MRPLGTQKASTPIDDGMRRVLGRGISCGEEQLAVQMVIAKHQHVLVAVYNASQLTVVEL